MRKNAWTLAELTVVMVAVVILTSATMSIMKNININKARVYVYSAMRNITMGNISVTHENNAFTKKIKQPIGIVCILLMRFLWKKIQIAQKLPQVL